jgi:hypothetical protein
MSEKIVWAITSVAAWPPGSIMVFDNSGALANAGSGDQKPHFGFGIVVANDGKGKIRVLWDAKCSRQFLEYDVKHLNPNVIRRGG